MAEKYFSAANIEKAKRLLRMAKVSISFSKGDPESYFIVSGIVKEDRTFESKVVYKKRLEETPEGPITSNCDCMNWRPDNPCHHAISLFIAYHIHRLHEEHFDGAHEISSTPPVALGMSLAVNVAEYGTIVNGPHLLVGAPSNPTYSSLQYLLHNKKVVTFPIPDNFKGKLVIQMTSREYFESMTNEFELIPQLKFKYENEQGAEISEISIFENLYLFDWKNGNAYHLPMSLKGLIQKIRISGSSLGVNDLIKLTSFEDVRKECRLIIDEKNFEDITWLTTSARAEILSTDKKNQLKLNIRFADVNRNIIPIPDVISAFSFSGGMLNSFKKKKDVFDFLSALVNTLEDHGETYKKHLISSSQKNKWQELINYMLEGQDFLHYHAPTRTIVTFKRETILGLIIAIERCYGENGWRFAKCDNEAYEWQFTLSSSILFQGLNEFYNRMLTLGVSLYYDRNEISRWSSKVRFERRASATKWFDLEMNVTAEDLSIIETMDLDSGIAITDKGLVLLSREQKDLIRFMKRYVDIDSQGKIQAKNESGEEISKFILPFNRARIFELFELRKLGIDGALTPEEIELCERLANLKEIPHYDLPVKMQGVLRPYQETGYKWLRFLYESKLGACLADDMGLGKTLQTIAFIKSVYHQLDRILIVCPVTILLNWEKEFRKFSDIEAFVYHGGSRQIPDGAKIILTSYGVMKKEIEQTFKDLHFDILVLDEVQHLKNIRSLGAFAARMLKTDFRICLTGTPVENDLAEFYNILDLAIPGIWGDMQFVRTTSNQKSRLMARKTAAPFILRRTKSQVLTELPPKIENNIYLNFNDEERANYVQSLVQIRKRIEQAPSKHKYGEILRGLLELRQKCLWQNQTSHGDMDFKGVDSTKIEFLVETLEQIIEEGHQAIVFSQFTTYLDIIQKILREKHWKLARIDGTQTLKKRQEQVDLFQEGKCPIFLISLKAGGVGLNLTAASYVFIMDPWWNPAVEQQAIDRAHRIGQLNTLTVYRPIIKNSVEEKVIELQQLKKELFKDLLPDDDENLFSGRLSMKDFESLLSDDKSDDLT
ncbi:MAG: hypothetical protein OHK0056_17640 [Bacteriovoracaceae bacterium]